MTAIIILNYNGSKDTIECLQSLLQQSRKDFAVVVADNCSQDDSLSVIKEWAAQHVDYCEAFEGEAINLSKWLTILSLNDNYGFAKGNNKAIAQTKADSYLCLNNDTVVEPDFFEKLMAFHEVHPEYVALTPAIRLYSKPDMMWNCGGRLVFGGRRYFYPYMAQSSITEQGHIDITFITGCALFVDKQLCSNGQLFTERFFFGEEDFEFSLRIQKQKKKMACVLDSVIYHKVGQSRGEQQELGKLLVHSINRMINLRQHYSPLSYFVWKKMFVFYTRKKFLGQATAEQRGFFLRTMVEESEKNDGVTKEQYLRYIQLFDAK